MKQNMIGVIGSGSWATALVKILLEDPERTLNWWVRDEGLQRSLQEEGINSKHLSDVRLDASRIHVTCSLSEVVKSSSDLFIVTPSAFVGDTLSMLPASAYEGKNMISAVKGAVLGKGLPMTVFLEKELNVDPCRICVVSGPSHAEEVALNLPTFLAVASQNEGLAEEVASMLRCDYLRACVTTDMEGVEYTAIMKNIYAIAVGICRGLNYGDNLCAVLTAAAVKEIGRVLDATFPLAGRDITDYCYLGDLMVTCWSQHSRNRALGLAVSRGDDPQSVFARMGSIAEGYFSAKIVHDHNATKREKIETPILESVYRVLYDGANPREEFGHLINRVL